MPIKTLNVLSRDDILLSAPVSSARQLIDFVAQHVHTRYGLEPEVIGPALEEREKWGSTGLGYGVAVPHARVSGLASPLLVFVRPQSAIDFRAPDGKPVGDFFVLLVPDTATQTHLELLAAIAGRLGDRSFREALRQSSSAQLIQGLLA